MLGGSNSAATVACFGPIAEWHVDLEKIVTMERLGSYPACPDSRKKPDLRAIRPIARGVSDRRTLGQQVPSVGVSEQTWRGELVFERQHNRSSSIYTGPAVSTKRRSNCSGAALSEPRSRCARVK